MHLSSRILGKTVVDQITLRSAHPLLRIGTDVFYRGDLARVGCYNFHAAAGLSTALQDHARELAVESTRDLFETLAPRHLILPHIGAVALAVLGACFEIKNLGGDAPLETWVAKHRAADAPDRFVTVHTMKAQAAKQGLEAHARRDAKARRTRRRDQAHRLRVDRFLTRQGRRTQT